MDGCVGFCQTWVADNEQKMKYRRIATGVITLGKKNMEAVNVGKVATTTTTTTTTTTITTMTKKTLKKKSAKQSQQAQLPMLGAIVGDIAGSTYERHNCKEMDKISVFATRSRVTDDSVLTLATAQRLLDYEDINDTNKMDEINDNDDGKNVETKNVMERSVMGNEGIDECYARHYQDMGLIYPKAGYGKSFKSWIHSKDPQPYGSWGNGSAMRVSPIGWIAPSFDWAMKEAAASAAVTHNSPEGIQGAQAIAVAVYLARQNIYEDETMTTTTNTTTTKKYSKDEIKSILQEHFPSYNLDRTVASIRPKYRFDVSCPGSVPESIIAFLDSQDFEDCIRKAISLGGDSDTIACMAGSIAHAYYGSIPQNMVLYCRRKLDKYQLSILDTFWQTYVAREGESNDQSL